MEQVRQIPDINQVRKFQQDFHEKEKEEHKKFCDQLKVKILDIASQMILQDSKAGRPNTTVGMWGANVDGDFCREEHEADSDYHGFGFKSVKHVWQACKVELEDLGYRVKMDITGSNNGRYRCYYFIIAW